nr:hypothetical protein PanWU01x14_217180 [Ipomoea trifida]
MNLDDRGIDFWARGAFVKDLHHALVNLDGYDSFGNTYELKSKVSGAGPDFQDSISGEYVGFPDDGVKNSRVSKKVLASALEQIYVCFLVFGFPANVAVIFFVVAPAAVEATA